jgi:hypothetical protein
MTEDKFYLHPENNSLTWTYFAPDSGSGGEYVQTEVFYSLIEEAAEYADVEYFFDYIESECNLYVVHSTEDGFAETDNEFRGLPCDIEGRTAETRTALINLAKEALHGNNDGSSSADYDYGEDKFYLHPDERRVTWVYYNSNSSAGGQYVYNEFNYRLIDHAAKYADTEEFFDYIGSECRQYLVDTGTDGFAEADDNFNNCECDFEGCTDKTRSALIRLALEASNGNAGDYYLGGEDEENEYEM